MKMATGLGRVVAGLLLVTLMLGTASGVWACSCVPPGDPMAEMEQATAVFAGRVYSMERSGGSVWVHFELSQVWKGPYQSILTVRTNDSSAACGFEFAQDQNYMVYASGETNDLQVSLCSRTRPLALAEEDLKVLGPGTLVTQMQGGETGGFDPNKVVAPVLSFISGVIVLGILLSGLLDFRPAIR